MDGPVLAVGWVYDVRSVKCFRSVFYSIGLVLAGSGFVHVIAIQPFDGSGPIKVTHIY